jgi:hypothetical protein
MSALPPKADINRGRLECLLIAISGHSELVQTVPEAILSFHWIQGSGQPHLLFSVPGKIFV